MKKATVNEGLTELVFILDKSGSMSGLESDTIGGFNSMIEKQKKLGGRAFVTTVLFDSESRTVHDRVELGEIGKMTEKDYFVGGCTALLDAIGSTVDHISSIHRYARPEDVPAKTIFVITTDGMENASREYRPDQVRKLIKKHQENGWEFLFLGANIDAVSVAGDFGIDREHAVRYKADKKGTELIYEELAGAVCEMRAGKGLKPCWSRKIQQDCEAREN